MTRDTGWMAVQDMTIEAETAIQDDAAASPQRADLLGIACLSTIAIVMTVWIGGLVWLALAVMNWLMS